MAGDVITALPCCLYIAVFVVGGQRVGVEGSSEAARNQSANTHTHTANTHGCLPPSPVACMPRVPIVLSALLLEAHGASRKLASVVT